jgi:3-isopropylmalate/(R)-2-methylmalate dehydratase large subunit
MQSPAFVNSAVSAFTPRGEISAVSSFRGAAGPLDHGSAETARFAVRAGPRRGAAIAAVAVSSSRPMTLTEKIIAKHAQQPFVEPGQNVWTGVSSLMSHDVCGPPMVKTFEKEFGEDARVWDKDRVILIPDHYIFTKNTMANRNLEIIRDFAHKQNLTHFYDITDLSNFENNPDYKGVCHIAFAQEGHARPGELMFGTDSHTCNAGAFGMFASGIGMTDGAFVIGTGKLLIKVPATMKFNLNGTLPDYILAKDLILQIIGVIGVAGATYRAMEFGGDVIDQLSMEERQTMCNMAIEAGGKNGIIAADAVTDTYLAGRTNIPYEKMQSDPGAEYFAEYNIDVSKLEPVVAKPHSPDNRGTARECGETRIDRVYIGSCTGGKTEDFLAAARILQGRKVSVPTFLVPATRDVHTDIMTMRMNGETLSEIFRNAGCIDPGSPGCAACLGGPSDTFARINEPLVCVSTTNRNFPGRMGNKDASIFLASPYTAAASAVTGYVTDPRKVFDFDTNQHHPAETLMD